MGMLQYINSIESKWKTLTHNQLNLIMEENDEMNNNLITERAVLKSIPEEDREFIFSEFSDAKITKCLYDEEPMTDINRN